MVVNKTTAVLYLIALSLSGFIHTFLRAEERVYTMTSLLQMSCIITG